MKSYKVNPYKNIKKINFRDARTIINKAALKTKDSFVIEGNFISENGRKVNKQATLVRLKMMYRSAKNLGDLYLVILNDFKNSKGFLGAF